MYVLYTFPMITVAAHAHTTLGELYPPSVLRVRTPRLELRVPCSVSDAVALADTAAAGVHDPAFMPFSSGWTDGSPEEVRGRVFRTALGSLAADPCTREALDLPFLVFCSAESDAPMGLTHLRLHDLLSTGDVSTGSWLGLRYQGRGFGKEMRAAMLALAFVGFGAQRATTKAREGNHASLAVTRSLGYTPIGAHAVMSRGAETVSYEFALSRGEWELRGALNPVVTWTGLEPTLKFLNLA